MSMEIDAPDRSVRPLATFRCFQISETVFPYPSWLVLCWPCPITATLLRDRSSTAHRHGGLRGAAAAGGAAPDRRQTVRSSTCSFFCMARGHASQQGRQRHACMLRRCCCVTAAPCLAGMSVASLQPWRWSSESSSSLPLAMMRASGRSFAGSLPSTRRRSRQTIARSGHSKHSHTDP